MLKRGADWVPALALPLAADSLSARTLDTPNQRINAGIPKKSKKGFWLL